MKRDNKRDNNACAPILLPMELILNGKNKPGKIQTFHIEKLIKQGRKK